MFRKSKRNAADKEPSMTDEELETRILQLPQVDGSAVAHSAPPPAPEGISSISSGLSIVGKIVGNGRLAIFGHVEGEVHASIVQIGDGAQVEGNIVAGELTIGGRVKGAIHANRVKLNSTAVVEGDIYHRSLAIEENAQFEGLSRRQENVIDMPSLVPAKLPQAQAVPVQGYVSPGNDQNQKATRDEPEGDASIVPTIEQSIEVDTWRHDLDKSDSVANTEGAIAEFARSEVHQAAYPNCTKCGKPMLLKRLHPGRFHYKGDFECQTCGRSMREVVTIASGDR